MPESTLVLQIPKCNSFPHQTTIERRQNPRVQSLVVLKVLKHKKKDKKCPPSSFVLNKIIYFIMDDYNYNNMNVDHAESSPPLEKTTKLINLSDFLFK